VSIVISEVDNMRHFVFGGGSIVQVNESGYDTDYDDTYNTDSHWHEYVNYVLTGHLFGIYCNWYFKNMLHSGIFFDRYDGRYDEF
jgi:hypothetical protein